MEPEIDDAHDATEDSNHDVASQDAQPTPPNEALAQKVTDALVKVGVIAEDDASRCRGLLEAGTAGPDDWLQLVEAALFPKPADSDE